VLLTFDLCPIKFTYGCQIKCLLGLNHCHCIRGKAELVSQLTFLFVEFPFSGKINLLAKGGSGQKCQGNNKKEIFHVNLGFKGQHWPDSNVIKSPRFSFGRVVIRCRHSPLLTGKPVSGLDKTVRFSLFWNS